MSNLPKTRQVTQEDRLREMMLKNAEGVRKAFKRAYQTPAVRAPCRECGSMINKPGRIYCNDECKSLYQKKNGNKYRPSVFNVRTGPNAE